MSEDELKAIEKRYPHPTDADVRALVAKPAVYGSDVTLNTAPAATCERCNGTGAVNENDGEDVCVGACPDCGGTGVRR